MSFKKYNLTEKERRQIINRLLAGSLTVFLASLMIMAYKTFHLERYLEELELKTYDFRVVSRLFEDGMVGRENRPSKDIVIVEFDDATRNIYQNEFGTWPWPREVHASIFDYAKEVGAKSLIYDIMFVAEQSHRQESDQRLIEAFRDYDNAYIGMNFDNNLNDLEKAGQFLTKKDIDYLKPLSLNLAYPNKNLSKTAQFQIDENFPFTGSTLTFTSYRSIMSGLMENGDRIALLNHIRDTDGISRRNPLFFQLNTRYITKSPHQPYRFDRIMGEWRDAKDSLVSKDGYFQQRTQKKTTALPVMQDPDTKEYFDQNNQPVNKEGYLLKTIKTPFSGIFPYMGLSALLHLKYDNNVDLELTKDNYVHFGDHHIPLDKNGNHLVNWYNRDSLRDLYSYTVNTEYPAMKAQIIANAELSIPEKKQQRVNLAKRIQPMQAYLEGEMQLRPYLRIPAWRIIKAQKDATNKHLSKFDQAENDQLKALLKDKVIFVGTTSISTYDIKSTPQGSMTPGIVIQASLFDNLYQNSFYIHRASKRLNRFAAIMLCLFTAFIMYKFRSAPAGAVTAGALMIVYLLLATYLFKTQGLWINVSMPIGLLSATAFLSFMFKYIVRDQEYERTYEMATTDSMTGLYNHRFFQEHMRLSMERADRANEKFSMVLIDIDRFKIFNDTYGHQAGDEVLRCVAQKLKNSVRTVDMVARYGGEELAVVLDKANEKEALEVAQKLVDAIADEPYPITSTANRYVSISCGVATYPIDGKDTEEMVHFCDEALYRAKECGRNQVGAQRDEDMVEKPEEDLNVKNGLIRPEDSPLGRPRDTFKNLAHELPEAESTDDAATPAEEEPPQAGEALDVPEETSKDDTDTSASA